jgi:ATP-binding cassette subfamily B protein
MIGAVGRLLRICAPERRSLIIGFTVTALASLLQVVPALVAVVVVVDLSEGRTFTTGDAVIIAAACFGSLALRYALARYANGILWVVSYEATGRIRHDLLDRMRAAPPSAISGSEAGRALTVLTFDAGKIAGFISWELPVLVSGVVVPIAVIVTLAFTVPLLAAAAVTVTLLAVPVLRFGLGRVMAVYEERRRLQGESSERMLEYVRGIDVIRAHDIAADRQDSLARSVEGIRDADIASVDRLTAAYSSFQALIDMGTALFVVLAGLLVADDPSLSGELVAALLLTTVLFRPQLDVGARALHLPELGASLRRVEAWQHLPVVPPRPEVDVARSPGGAVDVELVDITAGYGDGDDVITGVSIEVPAGSVTALVGPSGAGKTTLLRLVAGLLSARTGDVRLGGADIESMSLSQSAALVTAVFQDVGVLSGSISTIIGSGDPAATRERIVDAARAARIHDRIVELAHGYDTVIGEGARTLSGGERQRLGIARALCTNSPILLLDEASSALDPTNERLLREAIANLAERRTVIVVAHRLETIRNADVIHFLDGGRIVESGTHDQLLANAGRYADFWTLRTDSAGWTIGAATRS